MKNRFLLIIGIILVIVGLLFCILPFLQGWSLITIGFISIILYFLFVKIIKKSENALITLNRVYITTIIIVILIYALTTIDMFKISNNKKPIFYINLVGIKDGGTEIGYGLFYELIEWKMLDTKIIDGKEINGYSIGTELSYFPNYNYHLLGNNDNFKPRISLTFVEK